MSEDVGDSSHIMQASEQAARSRTPPSTKIVYKCGIVNEFLNYLVRSFSCNAYPRPQLCN